MITYDRREQILSEPISHTDAKAEKHGKATKLFKEKTKSAKSTSSNTKGGSKMPTTKSGKGETTTDVQHKSGKTIKMADDTKMKEAKAGKMKGSKAEKITDTKMKETTTKSGKEKGTVSQPGGKSEKMSIKHTISKGGKEAVVAKSTKSTSSSIPSISTQEAQNAATQGSLSDIDLSELQKGPEKYAGMSLRQAIEVLIEESERELIPKYLRLGFHDCVGGCDGCVDLSNPDNNGLLEPIEEIAPVVEAFKSQYSRADVWAMATMVSADKSLVALDENGELVDERPEGLHWLHFPLTHVGRKDCEGANAMGIGGPDIEMPSNDLTTHELLTFFSDEFNFSTDETVAIMGAHSVAVASRTNVGFGNLGKEEGWVCHAEEYILDNRYYAVLVGDEGDEVNSAPNWELEFVDNSEGIEYIDEEDGSTQYLEAGIPHRYQWFNTDKCDDNERPIMTNADMALVRDLSGHISTDNSGTDGKVSCSFKQESGNKACPVAHETMQKVLEYKMDKTLFLFEFEQVLGKMINNGYSDDDLQAVDL